MKEFFEKLRKKLERMAKEEFKDYLFEQLLESKEDDMTLPKAKWVKTNTDLAELWLSLFVDKAIEVEGKPATIGFYEKMGQFLFGISFSNISVTDRKMRDRKKGITPFLDRLKKGMTDRADDLDENS
jgi:RteC protein